MGFVRPGSFKNEKTATFKATVTSINGESYLASRNTYSLPAYSASTVKTNREVGHKRYELTNHLGNVLVTVSDLKLSPDDTTADYYLPQVMSYTDYYAFGSQMPGRFGNTGNYRYGFQGQEKDDEIKGEGNSINYSYRIHDPRLGRFLSVDPLAADYPFYSPYAFSGNRVVDMRELEGLEPVPLDGAKIADDVYLSNSTGVIGDGWMRSNIYIPGVKYDDPENGFKSALYSRKLEDGGYEYVYATAGTEDITDVIEDINQLFGTSKQYERSVFNAQQIANYFNDLDAKLTFIGHSLGGGLAAANAMATGLEAMTYNAAPLSKFTKENLRLNYRPNIDAFVVTGELVSYLSSSILMKPDGNIINLPGPSLYGYLSKTAAQVVGGPLGGTIARVTLTSINMKRRAEAHMLNYLIKSIETNQKTAETLGYDPWSKTTVK